MIANYHTHTWRCNHAEKNERCYVETALRTGIKVLGFSDHSPYPFGDGYCSPFRMRCEQTEDYLHVIRSLRDEFRGGIDIHMGFEAEYYPAYFGGLLEFLEPTDYEYLILGQHFLGNERDDAPCTTPTDDPARLRAFVRQTSEALNTGAFSLFAHPDVLRFTGDEGIYRAEMRTLCREARSCGVPLEINLLGLAGHRHYPRDTFWEIAGEVGNKVVISWDAHSAASMDNPAPEAAGMALIERYGLDRVDYLTLVRPHPFMARV